MRILYIPNVYLVTFKKKRKKTKFVGMERSIVKKFMDHF